MWDAVPFSNRAYAQAATPPLSETWDFSTDLVHGVNLGGWLTLEPFITPYLYEPFADTDYPAVDEWTLCENLGTTAAAVITNHYNTFIVSSLLAPFMTLNPS